MQKHHIIISLIIAGLITGSVLLIIGFEEVEAPVRGLVGEESDKASDLLPVTEEVPVKNHDLDTVLPGKTPDVTKNPVATSTGSLVPKSNCVVGGCSGELCTEASNDVVSTCIWREEFACYKTASCERQENGQCGWTPSAALNQCLINSQKENLSPETVVPQ